jgi:hypothetical protein
MVVGRGPQRVLALPPREETMFCGRASKIENGNENFFFNRRLLANK